MTTKSSERDQNMKATNRCLTWAGLILWSGLAIALTGCRTHVVHERTRTVYLPPPQPPPAVVHVASLPAPQPPPVIVTPPPAPAPVVVIRSATDFYEPLARHGRWVVVGSYGHSWIPAGVPAGWRPYAHGYWQHTDAGWYWMSDEPWGWATYHYGRWDWHTQHGWIWVPHTQWAPAWVSWREGAGYVGWAPLRPSTAMGVGISTVQYEPAFASRAYVFVEHRRMLEPVRPTTVVVNNTTIINQTVNLTNVKVVNETVINAGPRPEVIERASGRKVQAVPAHEFRRREEVAATTRQRNLPAVADKKAEPPTRTEPQTAPPPTVAPRNPPVIENPAVVATPRQTPATPARPTAPPTRPENPTRPVSQPAPEQVRTPAAPPPIVAPKALPEPRPAPAAPLQREVRPVEKPAVAVRSTLPAANPIPARTETPAAATSGKTGTATNPAMESRPRNEVRPLAKPEVNAPAKLEAATLSPVRSVPTPPKASPAEKRLISPREQSRMAEPAAPSRRIQETNVPVKRGEEPAPRPASARPLR